MARFLCWLPDHGTTPADGAREIEVSHAIPADRQGAWAAEAYVEKHDREALEFPFVREVAVRSPDGSESLYEVQMSVTPEYHARPKRKT